MIGSNFSYPLNFFAHALELEEGSIRYMHYGFYDREDQPVGEAQQNSTNLIMSKLPEPPARVLEVGIGLGTTASLLESKGYGYTGITPDAAQIEYCSKEGRDLRCVKFQDLDRDEKGYDVIVFQESAQYIDYEDILRKSAELLEDGGEVVIADEIPAELIAKLEEVTPKHGLEIEEVLDVTERAMPSFRYLLGLLKKYFDRLVEELSLDRHEAERMIKHLERRIVAYEKGEFTYSIIHLRKPA